MKIIATVLLLGFLFYMFSFAQYNWYKNNKLGAIGSLLLALITCVTAFIGLFFMDISQ